MEIRKYKPEDFENLRIVCHETATAKQYVSNKELVSSLYCDYYCNEEPDNVFVVSDENGEAKGYILCAENYESYKKIFNEKYLAKVKKMSLFEWLIKVFEPVIYDKIAKEYPAHLHIDLLPCCQGQGLGTKLVETLLGHLKAKGVKGVSLTVGADNKGAIRFYKRLGFKRIKSIFGEAEVFAKTID